MATRYFALILGIAFLLAGVAGFVPALLTMPTDEHALRVMGPGHGLLFGLFHVNAVHNAVHILFGIWGIAAFSGVVASRLFARSVAIIYGVLVLFGLCPVGYVNTLWGLCPVYGNDVWLHAIFAVAGAYFGWAPAPAISAAPAPQEIKPS